MEDCGEEDLRGRLALERSLQKAYKIVQSLNSSLRAIKSETLPIVKSVTDLLEQRELCNAVDIEEFQSCDFIPNSKPLLIRKIENEILTKLRCLENAMYVRPFPFFKFHFLFCASVWVFFVFFLSCITCR